jgi:hypothetical protein
VAEDAAHDVEHGAVRGGDGAGVGGGVAAIDRARRVRLLHDGFHAVGVEQPDDLRERETCK